MKKNLLLVMVLVLSLFLTGCVGEEYTIAIHKNGTAEVTLGAMLEENFYNDLVKNADFKDKNITDLGYKKTTKSYKGSTYISFDRTVKCASIAKMTKMLEDTESFYKAFQLIGNTTSEYTEMLSMLAPASVLDVVKADTQTFQATAKAIMGKEDAALYKQMGTNITDKVLKRVSIAFDSEIKDTNGTLSSDKKQASWFIKDFSADTLMQASTKGSSAYLKDTAAPYSKTFKDGKYYNEDYLYYELDVVDGVGVKSVTVNGKKRNAMDCIEEPGKYKMVMTDFAGNTRTITFYIDCKSPAVKLKKTSKKCTITFSDNRAVKSAALNGKAIKSGKVVTKKGKYTVKVTDKAGNVTRKTFTIK